MYRTFFVFLKCTIQGGPKVDVLLIAFLYLWLNFWEGIDKYWIVPVRKLFYFHHWLQVRQCDCAVCACRVVQTLHLAGQVIVRMRTPVYGCCMACCNWPLGWYGLWQSIQLISRVTKHTLHVVILILLIACVINQCQEFFLCCHYMSSTNSVLSAKRCLHLGKLS